MALGTFLIPLSSARNSTHSGYLLGRGFGRQAVFISVSACLNKGDAYTCAALSQRDAAQEAGQAPPDGREVRAVALPRASPQLGHHPLPFRSAVAYFWLFFQGKNPKAADRPFKRGTLNKKNRRFAQGADFDPKPRAWEERLFLFYVEQCDDRKRPNCDRAIRTFPAVAP